MDHPCYKCGHSVEDGKPFCAQCGAPQIRVAMPEPAQTVPAVEEVVPVSDREVGAFLPPISAVSLPVRWPHTMRSCVLAASVGVGLTVLGLRPFVGALITGFLAVAFSRQRGAGTVIRAAAGARLGALSGLVFFGGSTILQLLAVVVLHKGAEIRSQMIDTFQQAAARYPGPELQPVLDFVKSPGGFAFMMVASVFVGFVAFTILGGVGGALGASLLRRRDRP